ncbi:4Fe-4S double cluster binding domain-containing protein [Desulfacinum infernum DSM 9756]|uniref:4Fe-4S double cluster binding domain-containing protein n=1 Tax=Desulfacinum infernum DSM 9756 TaxID=1121391 RepID=A0A1M4TPA4_9BACT|nr:4Fe-4S double cluster binding domain-containing protein [Desulfacinum infernum]SHE46349.1 4Fe-4S double cluster binding domain-containing protein [Desulfacinum infernum DSM 9756]
MWLDGWMRAQGIEWWGVADLGGLKTPVDRWARSFARAVSWVVPMNPDVMMQIENGPTPAYAEEYARVNRLINSLSRDLVKEWSARGVRAQAVAASERTDAVGIRGDFPHKTAATRAGLGWVGRNCQLVTRRFGPWVRLATVFVDAELPCGPAVERDFCGRCRRCVEACPAGALKGGRWRPGIPRSRLLDARACDQWKKTHYPQYHGGHNCGICSSVCPYGRKWFKRYGGSREP